MLEEIKIKGARAHNLKNIDLNIPRDKLVVITGLSGSGKSSLAFDTIYAEGQRRYVESLSSYARQFLGQMDKPDVDYIEGLSPAISIDQKTTSHNPRSTVGTVTEIYDYLRLIFARIGTVHCPHCGKPITKQSIDQIVDSVLSLPEKTKIMVMAQVVHDKKGEHKKIIEKIRKEGFVRLRIDGQLFDINDTFALEKNKKHNIEVVVDRLVIKPGINARLNDSIETALKLGEDIVYIQIIDGELLRYSQQFACIDCGISMPSIEPKLFSFNSPYGACPDCNGLGSHREFDIDLIMPDKSLSFQEGLLTALSKNPVSYAMTQIAAILKAYGHDLGTPWNKLEPKLQNILLYGTGEKKFSYSYENFYGEVKDYNNAFEGIIPLLNRRYKETDSDIMRDSYERYMSNIPCAACHGKRLRPEALAVKLGGKNIDEVTSLSISEAAAFFQKLTLSDRELIIAHQILKEINVRLSFLVDVGLGYLTLSRKAGTLSGGEAQRIRLATQIGSGLMGVLYILDEPSIGLHQRDNNRLLATLEHLRDIGNTVIVVEHDEDTMYAADMIIDIGPKAGAGGGQVVAQGTVEEIKNNPHSITGQYLSRRKFIALPETRRSGNGNYITVCGAFENNLKNIDVKFPLGTFTVVTGVSGSGKSTLINEVLLKGLSNTIYKSNFKNIKCKKITGAENIDKINNIDQSPIGRTPRSNPATYTGIFDIIRETFAQTAEAKMRGYKPGRFSFNVKGGRCEACRGDGIIKIEMHFLPDVYVPCEVCHGNRYNRETLEVKYKGKTIADVLNMVVDEAAEFFKNIPRLARQLQILQDVGLGYIKLGQPATTLSGGEAQRIKLAAELSKKSSKSTLYILDEPTTGLHTADIHKLLEVLQRLVESGNTVIVIEHNLDVIKTADYLIDLGPEGGDGGGFIVACGTPEKIAATKNSYTGKFLKPILKESASLTKSQKK